MSDRLQCTTCLRDIPRMTHCPNCHPTSESASSACSVCVWTEDDDGNWFTACGEGQVFTTGNVTENHYKFCPYCGKAIKAVTQNNDKLCREQGGKDSDDK